MLGKCPKSADGKHDKETVTQGMGRRVVDVTRCKRCRKVFKSKLRKIKP